MADTPGKFYLTTPIYYVNARPHIGHAYSTIAADVIARRHRLLGPPVGEDGFKPTFFLTGTDEHGQKVQRSAEKAGIPPQQFADQVSKTFSDLWARMGITNDDYIRTTDPRHKRGVQKLWTTLVEAGAIYLSSYTGQYSVGEEMFIDGPPGTIGPDGKPTETVTEENYFFRLSDYQLPLIDLIESGTLHIQPETVRNEVLSFLRGNAASVLSDFSKPIIDDGVPLFTPASLDAAIANHRLRVSRDGVPYVPGALKDLSISRTTFTWGIPVPGDEKHVIYVWLDALANYMTAIGYGSDDPADIAKFEKYWPADLHLVGKEITRFHCVYWPAFLMALNPKLKRGPGEPLPVLTPEQHAVWARKWIPKSVVANGWLLFEESKMSKSRGNVVRTETILDAFGPLCPPVPLAPPTQLLPPTPERAEGPAHNSLGRSPRDGQPDETRAEGPTHALTAPPTKAQQDLFAADVIRYFLLREIPFGQDGSFSFDALITRYNADLANGYGNLVSRTLTMVNKYFEGVIPSELDDFYKDGHTVADKARTIGEFVGGLTTKGVADIWRMLDTLDFSNYLTRVQGLIKWADEVLSVMKPWKEQETPQSTARVRAQALYQASETIRIITVLLYPVLPCATASVWSQLGLDPAQLTTGNLQPATLSWGGLRPGTKLGPLAPIFPRADKGLAQIMTDMESANTTKAPEPTSTEPHAGPRTATLPIDNPGATVAGSHALTTERPGTPPHTEAHPSGVFASQPATDTLQSATISIDDFVKIDLRVAQIVVAERIPKADKLLRLEVDLGPNYARRQILSGIAEWYTPEELIGRRIAIIANLAPRKMRGLESHGMLLAASGEDHASKPVLASFSDDIPLGSRIR